MDDTTLLKLSLNAALERIEQLENQVNQAEQDIELFGNAIILIMERLDLQHQTKTHHGLN